MYFLVLILLETCLSINCKHPFPFFESFYKYSRVYKESQDSAKSKKLFKNEIWWTHPVLLDTTREFLEGAASQGLELGNWPEPLKTALSSPIFW